MKAKLIAAALALGLSGQAAAQEPVANVASQRPVANLVGNVGQTVGTLAPNLANTVESLLRLEITNTVLALNQTVTDLHMGLTAGTPLATDASLNDTLMVLVTPQTDMVDALLAGQIGLADTVSALQKLATLDPYLVRTLVRGLLTSPSGTVLDPEILSTVLISLLPLQALHDGNTSLGGDLSLAAAGSGGLSADALPLPLDALDTGTLTALLGGTSLPGLQ